MSASIRFRVISAGTSVGVNAPSSFLEVFEEVFRPLPAVLSESDLVKLRVLSVSLTCEKAAMRTLIEAIERMGEIEVFAVY